MDAFTALFLNRFLKNAGFGMILINTITLSFVISAFAVAGAFVGQQFDYVFTEFGKAKSIVILLALGIKIIIKSQKPRFEEMNYELDHPKIIFFFSIAVSMNAFVLGLALPAFDFHNLQIYTASIVIFLISTNFAILTRKITENFKIASRLEFAGGIVLIGSAVYYLSKLFRIIS
jgi:putative Mn2+ efflux pump MntP